MLAIILDPTLTIYVGPFIIYKWGLMVSIGIIFGLLLSWILAKKERLNFDYVLNIILISIILGFVGARLLFIFLESAEFQNPIDIIRIWDGGLALYGGLALAIFGGVIYAKKKKLDVMKYADMFVIPITLSVAIARIGCTLVNDHLGKITSLPFGITVDNITRHPISAYESIILFILFFILIIWRKYFIKIKGFSTLFTIFWYSLFRFIIDMFKDFQGRTNIFYANQIFLLIVFVLSFYFLMKLIIKNKKSKN